jgi:pyrroline-5-carboxylate reductase
MAEAMIEAGMHVGLPQAEATRLAIQTVYGAGKLLASQDEAPAELRRKVTSPGGTTQAGIQVLEAHGLRATLQAAVAAARDRGVELGRETLAKLAKN